MSEQSFVGQAALGLDAIFQRLKADEEARRRALRRGAAAVAVAVLHLLMVLVLLTLQWAPLRASRPSVEPPVMWLVLQARSGQPKAKKQNQEQPQEAEPIQSFVIPPLPVPPTIAIDPALALGEALKCGASSYEYLTKEERARCKHVPWHYKIAKDGSVILDVPADLLRPKPEHETGATAAQHQMNTQNPCPADENVPCLSNIINGGNHYP